MRQGWGPLYGCAISAPNFCSWPMAVPPDAIPSNPAQPSAGCAGLGHAASGIDAQGRDPALLWQEYKAQHPDGYQYSRLGWRRPRLAISEVVEEGSIQLMVDRCHFIIQAGIGQQAGLSKLGEAMG